jgi:hypothetical protein
MGERDTDKADFHSSLLTEPESDRTPVEVPAKEGHKHRILPDKGGV